MFKYKKNLGMSLIEILVALGLLAFFITAVSYFLKNYFSVKHTIESSAKSLDTSSSIIYEAFDSMSYLVDNLGRGNCQNLTIEDILTDLYRCSCIDQICKKVSCPKVEGTGNFVLPILGINDSDFEKTSTTGGDNHEEVVLSDKFNSVYLLKPQTATQLHDNGMPKEVVTRCLNNPLFSSARISGLSQAEINYMLNKYQEKSILQEYFALITKLLKDEINVFKLYSQLISSESGLNTSDINELKKYNYYPERSCTDPSSTADPNPNIFNINPKIGSTQLGNYGNTTISSPNSSNTTPKTGSTQLGGSTTFGSTGSNNPSNDATYPRLPWQYGTSQNSDNSLIQLGSPVTPNKRSDQPFTCSSYTLSNHAYDLLASSEKDIISEYTKVKNALTNLKSKYQSNDKLKKIIEELITQFSQTEMEQDTTQQKPFSYLDKIIRLRQLNTETGTSAISSYNIIKQHANDLKDYAEIYNRGEDPFLNKEQNPITKTELCTNYSVSMCFNVQDSHNIIQDDNSNQDSFLAGSNPNLQNSKEEKIDCYGDDINKPVCKDRSSIILEVRAYPMSIDSKIFPTEENIEFYKYNDSGSLNRLLKMVYILHWTKKIDGQYKYFRNSGSLTMATSSNLRK